MNCHYVCSIGQQRRLAKEVIPGELLKNERSHIGARDLANRDAGQVEQDPLLAGRFVNGQLAWADDDPVPVAVAQQLFLPISWPKARPCLTIS